MLNVRDECDLPEDDGYDLFTRETEVERYRKYHSLSPTRRQENDGGRPSGLPRGQASRWGQG